MTSKSRGISLLKDLVHLWQNPFVFKKNPSKTLKTRFCSEKISCDFPNEQNALRPKCHTMLHFLPKTANRFWRLLSYDLPGQKTRRLFMKFLVLRLCVEIAEKSRTQGNRIRRAYHLLKTRYTFDKNLFVFKKNLL